MMEGWLNCDDQSNCARDFKVKQLNIWWSLNLVSKQKRKSHRIIEVYLKIVACTENVFSLLLYSACIWFRFMHVACTFHLNLEKRSSAAQISMVIHTDFSSWTIPVFELFSRDFKFNEFFSVLNSLRLINNNRDDAERFFNPFKFNLKHFFPLPLWGIQS